MPWRGLFFQAELLFVPTLARTWELVAPGACVAFRHWAPLRSPASETVEEPSLLPLRIPAHHRRFCSAYFCIVWLWLILKGCHSAKLDFFLLSYLDVVQDVFGYSRSWPQLSSSLRLAWRGVGRDTSHAFHTKSWTSCLDIVAGRAVKNLNFLPFPSAKRSLFFFF